MEITLEKIELVKDRTGVSYKEAKEALETANGSVVDAIISIEESIDESQRNSLGDQSTALIDKIKELVKRGNVARIQVKNPDGETVLNIPVNAGIAGAVVAPWGMLKVKGKTEETLGKATEALKNKFSKNDSDDVTEFAEDFDVKNFEEDEE